MQLVRILVKERDKYLKREIVFNKRTQKYMNLSKVEVRRRVKIMERITRNSSMIKKVGCRRKVQKSFLIWLNFELFFMGKRYSFGFYFKHSDQGRFLVLFYDFCALSE
jgi:hypothetical protein